MNIEKILIRPALTEKGTDLSKNQVYTFEVDLVANKNQVKQALEKLYQVKVKAVRIVLRKGKTRRVGKAMKPKKMSSRKFAYITISKGKIDLFPQT